MRHHVAPAGRGLFRARRPFRTRAVLFAAILSSATVSLHGQALCPLPPVTADAWRLELQDLSPLREHVGEPGLVRLSVGEPGAGRTGALETAGVLHGLFETPIELLATTIRDVGSLHEFVPRLYMSEVICTDGQLTGHSRVLYELSFRFLVFRQDYRFVTDYFVADDLETSGEYRVWWQLHEPLDNEIVDASGSWYLKRVVLDGAEYTYVAYAVNTVFRERTIGLSAMLARYGERDARTAMLAYVEEAERRGR